MLSFRRMFIDEARSVQGTTEGLCAMRRDNPAAYHILRRHLGAQQKVLFPCACCPMPDGLHNVMSKAHAAMADPLLPSMLLRLTSCTV